MPFGAEVSADGTTRFRLWAPAARQIDLELAVGDTRRELAMVSLGEGWFGADEVHAPAGSRYGFRIDGGSTVPEVISGFLDVPGLDGFLVGGASLNYHLFEEIINAAHRWQRQGQED